MCVNVMLLDFDPKNQRSYQFFKEAPDRYAVFNENEY
jgi:hypothetical protein